MSLARHRDVLAGAAYHLDSLSAHEGDSLDDDQRADSQRHGDALMRAKRGMEADNFGNPAEGGDVVGEAAKHCHDMAGLGDGEAFTRTHKAACAHHAGNLKALAEGYAPGGHFDDSDDFADGHGSDNRWTPRALAAAGRSVAALHKRLDRVLPRRAARVVRLAGDRYSQQNAGAVRGVDVARRCATFVMSAEQPDGDRVGDIVSVAGIDLTQFLKNPVALWAHDSSSYPVGLWRDVRKEGRRLVGTLYFADTEEGNKAFEAVRAGLVRAVSIGFNPTRRPEPIPETGGSYFPASELLECSLCPIGANSEALLLT